MKVALWQRITGSWLLYLDPAVKPVSRIPNASWRQYYRSPVSTELSSATLKQGGFAMIKHTERRRTREAYWNEVCFV